MYTIFDYLKYYKNIPLKDVHWNVMDNLLCAILTYLPAESFDDALSMNEFYEYAIRYDDGTKENPLVSLVYELMELLRDASRYQSMQIYNFRNIRNNDTQFGAAAFHIQDTTIISYKGTDYSLIGWFENFRLAYEYPTSTHKLAISYLLENADLFQPESIYVCGHSKGGNLALVAAMEAPDHLFDKIGQVYNFDGPGLRKEEFIQQKFRKLSKKLTNIIPSVSVVGILMNNTDYHVIKSSKHSVNEHYPTSWNVFGECFIRGKLSSISKKLHHSTTKGIEDLDYEKTKEAFEFIFQSFGRDYASDLTLTFDDILTFYENIKNIDPEVKKSLDSILSTMISTGFRLPIKRKNE